MRLAVDRSEYETAPKQKQHQPSATNPEEFQILEKVADMMNNLQSEVQ